MQFHLLRLHASADLGANYRANDEQPNCTANQGPYNQRTINAPDPDADHVGTNLQPRLEQPNTGSHSNPIHISAHQCADVAADEHVCRSGTADRRAVSTCLYVAVRAGIVLSGPIGNAKLQWHLLRADTRTVVKTDVRPAVLGPDTAAFGPSSL